MALAWLWRSLRSFVRGDRRPVPKAEKSRASSIGEPSSLDLVAELVRFEREMQVQALDAIDAKAGMALGFGGAIVALTGLAGEDPWVIPGVVAAGVAVTYTLAVLRAGRYERQSPEESKRWWLWEERAAAREEMMNSEILVMRRVDERISRKTKHLRYAWGWLVAAVLLLAAATIIPSVRGWLIEGSADGERRRDSGTEHSTPASTSRSTGAAGDDRDRGEGGEAPGRDPE